MIWLVTIGEPVPGLDKNERLMRTFNLGKNLSEKGQKVIWWTNSFNQQNRKQRINKKDQKDILINKNFTIKVINTNGYKKSISISRMIHNFSYSIKLIYFAKKEKTKPNIIISSYPILESCISSMYIKSKETKFVIDIRDLWPDVVKERIKNRLIINLIDNYYHFFLKKIFSKVDLIISPSKSYIEWSKKYHNRNINEYCLPLGYDLNAIEEKISKNYLIQKANIKINSDSLIISFFGRINSSYFEFLEIFSVSKKLLLINKNIKFIICGVGDDYADFKKKYTSKNLFFFGQLNGNEISDLMKISSIGIAPYKNLDNFNKNIPNKYYEYTSGNLYILTRIEGDSLSFIKNNNLGELYKDENELFNKIIEIEKKFGNKKIVNNNSLKKIYGSKLMNYEFIDYLISKNYLI